LADLTAAKACGIADFNASSSREQTLQFKSGNNHLLCRQMTQYAKSQRPALKLSPIQQNAALVFCLTSYFSPGEAGVQKFLIAGARRHSTAVVVTCILRKTLLRTIISSALLSAVHYYQQCAIINSALSSTVSC